MKSLLAYCIMGGCIAFFPSSGDLKAFQVQNDSLQARMLDSLGRVAEDQQQFVNALEIYNQAISIYQRVKDTVSVASDLENLGFVYRELNQYEKAVEVDSQALRLRVGINDSDGIASSYGNLGEDYNNLSRYETSNQLLEKALLISREKNIRNGEGSALTTLSSNANYLGHYEKALQYAREALPIHQEIGNPSGQARTLLNLAYAQYSLEQFQTAIDNYQRALKLLRELRSRKDIGLVYDHLTLVYNDLGQHQRAMQYADSAMAIAKETNNRLDEGRILSKMGLIYISRKQFQNAIDSLNKALPIFREYNQTEREGTAYYRLMLAWSGLKNTNLAIFYGKQAVNIYQQVRSSIKNLSQDIQKDYLKSKEPTYRTLADLLIAQGRLPEAEQVIRMLKEEEYFEFVRGESNTATSSTRATYSREESEWRTRLEDIKDTIGAIGRTYQELNSLKNLTPDEQRRLDQSWNDLRVAQKNMYSLFDSLSNASLQWNQKGLTVFDLKESKGMMELLKNLGDDVVAIYTLVGERTYRAILVTPATWTYGEYKITSSNLNKKIQAFRDSVQHPQSNSTPLAKELYRILIKPIISNVRAAKAKTIMWSLDGALRYLPVNALHDGKQFFLEQYTNVVFTPASIPRLVNKVTSHEKALGFGVSKSHGKFVELPYVPDELKEIIRTEKMSESRGVLPGIIRLDSQFTKTEMFASLRGGFPLVHFATHFQLNPGDEDSSFMLMGDGSQLTVREISSLPNVFDGVDLLTLSACNTGVGNATASGKEVESFNVEAQRQGARAVIASLWPVQDKSTKGLMKSMYLYLASEHYVSKAEALRQAQLSLLNDSASGRSFHRNRIPPYSHPYYWAPFILIGNWK
jgi:CHAT domain-containing protein/tetratricopeptide (TPR) repeat protein